MYDMDVCNHCCLGKTTVTSFHCGMLLENFKETLEKNPPPPQINAFTCALVQKKTATYGEDYR